MAVKRETMRQQLQPLFDERIAPETVQLAPLSIYNMVVYEYLASLGERDSSQPAEALVVLSMGVETTDVLITEGARPVMRTIAIGGGHFTQALMKELSLSHEDAERAKRKAGRENALAIDQALQHAAQTGRGHRLAGEGVLQLQIHARHVNAAGVGVAQVHRHVDRGGDLNGLAAARGHAQGQCDVGHAHPVQRTRRGGGVERDIGKAARSGRIRSHDSGNGDTRRERNACILATPA